MDENFSLRFLAHGYPFFIHFNKDLSHITVSLTLKEKNFHRPQHQININDKNWLASLLETIGIDKLPASLCTPERWYLNDKQMPIFWQLEQIPRFDSWLKNVLHHFRATPVDNLGIQSLNKNGKCSGNQNSFDSKTQCDATSIRSKIEHHRNQL